MKNDTIVLGGILATRTTCLSPDGAYVSVAVGKDIRLHSVTTGERIIALYGHTKNVTSIKFIDGSGALKIISSSLDGTIKLWDVMEAKQTRSWKVGLPIEDIVLVSENQVLISCEWGPNLSGRIFLMQLDCSKPKLQLLKAPSPLRFCPVRGPWVAAVERNSLHVFRRADSEIGHIKLHHTRHLMCAAFDSTCTHVAAGDESGRIVIWSGINKYADSVMRGQEATLVIWQLETLHKTFLPRLGGPITGIIGCSTDAAKYAVSQEDNVIRMVSLATMQVLSSVYGLRPTPALPDAGQVRDAVCLQPGTGQLVLSCSGGQLQFYDIAQDRHASRMTIIPRNNVVGTAEIGRETAPEPYVSHICFSPGAQWLVTVEVAPSLPTMPAPLASKGSLEQQKSTLKIWEATRGSQAAYRLNTLFHDPHNGRIVGLAHDPSSMRFATLGAAAHTFQQWEQCPIRRTPASGVNSPACHWASTSVGAYQGLPLRSVVYSPDGSLLAVATDSTTTLWRPQQCELVAALPTPTACGQSHIVAMCFSVQAPTLLAVCEGEQPCMVAWDLLTLSLAWVAPGRVQDIAPHPRCPQFAAALSQLAGCNVITLLDARTGTSLKTWRSNEAGVARVLFLEHRSILHSQLASRCGLDVDGLDVFVAVTQDRRVCLQHLNTGQSESTRTDELAILRSQGSDLHKSIEFNALFADREVRATVRSHKFVHVDVQSKIRDVLAAPSHLLPSAPVMCSMMLKSLLLDPAR